MGVIGRAVVPKQDLNACKQTPRRVSLSLKPAQDQASSSLSDCGCVKWLWSNTGQWEQSIQTSEDLMQHKIVKVISKLVLNIAKSRQSIQDKNLTQDYLFTGTTEEPCVLPWEQSRPDHVWVPHARRHTSHCCLLREVYGSFTITASFSVNFSVLKHVSTHKKQESCGLLTHICIKPQINLPLLLFSIPSDDWK